MHQCCKPILALSSLLLVFALVGCKAEPQAGPPPIAFSFRKAQVPTRGLVVGLSNTSTNQSLTDLVVQVTAPNEQRARSHRVGGPIEPQDTITIGWMELDGWKLKPGDSLTVSCQEFSEASKTEVPEL
jgi:hypothetical protein